MATAFMGYVLPWGQMSFWAATVITNLFSAIPLFGENVTEWMWGGFSVDNPTLIRFYSSLCDIVYRKIVDCSLIYINLINLFREF